MLNRPQRLAELSRRLDEIKEKDKALVGCQDQRPPELIVKNEIVGPIVSLINDMAYFRARIRCYRAALPAELSPTANKTPESDEDDALTSDSEDGTEDDVSRQNGGVNRS